MELKDSFFLRALDKTLVIAGIILSIVMIIQGVMIGRYMYLFMGSLVLISCFLWLALRKSHPFEFHLTESRTLTTFWAICFFGLYTLSVLSVYLRPDYYERPVIYFILTALMAGVIACEIFTSGRRHANFILIQVLLLGVSIAWSQLLIFPSLLGIDPWFHSAFTNWIINDHFIPEGYGYSELPLFHLTIAVTTLISSLPYKLANMVSVSLGQIICNVVFVVLISNYLFKNHRIALLAALMVVIANHHIRMSYWSIPNAFAGVFIPIVVYLVLSTAEVNSQKMTSPHMKVLMLLMMVAIILTHTIAAMCMAILLFVAWGALTFYRVYSQTSNYIKLLIPFGFTIMMFAWWTYTSDHISTLGKLIKWGFSIDAFIETPPESFQYAVSVPLGESIFNLFGLYLFFAVSLIGICYMVSRRGNSSMFLVASIGVTPLVVAFISLISGSTVIETRWWYFAQILLSIPVAVAIYLMMTWHLRKALYLNIFVLGIVAALSFLMIMSSPANVDNLLFSSNSHMKFAPTEAELESITTLTEKWDGSIKTDDYFVASQRYQHPQVSSFSQQIHSNDYLDLEEHILLIRGVTIGKPFMIFSALSKLDYDINVKLDQLGFSRIYDSNSGRGYRV